MCIRDRSNEGGLFVPESFPQVDVKALCELDYPAMAAAVIKEYLTEMCIRDSIRPCQGQP